MASFHKVVRASDACLHVEGMGMACASCQGSCSSGVHDGVLEMDSCKASHVEGLVVVVYVFLAITRLRNQRMTPSHFVFGHPSYVLSACHQAAFEEPGSRLSCLPTPPDPESGSGASAAQSSCAGPAFPAMERPLAVSLVLPS